MSQLCAATKCNRTSRGLCDCCQQNLCIQHLSEHNASLVSELNPLTDEINALGDRFKSLNIEKAIGNCRRKLEQWRDDCYQKIDRLFQQKWRELDQLADQKVKKYHQEILRIRAKIADLIREQETTRQDIDSLISATHHLKEQMNNIENTCFSVETRPLIINDSYIHIREIFELDLSTLSPVYKKFDSRPGSRMVINSNDRFLMIHRKPNLCLVDREMNIVQEVLWTHDEIYDVCWSTTINRFILVEGKRIFLIDDEKMIIDNVPTIEERDWLSCTCSETFLFLVTNEQASSIMKFTLLPRIELTKTWKSPQTCASDDAIMNIVYDDGTLGVVIRNQTKKSMRLELRSVETLDCIWILRFDTVCNQTTMFHFCSLPCNQWLVVDYEARRLMHVTKDGKLKATIPYDTIPRCANIFSNILVVSTKSNGINFHRL